MKEEKNKTSGIAGYQTHSIGKSSVLTSFPQSSFLHPPNIWILTSTKEQNWNEDSTWWVGVQSKIPPHQFSSPLSYTRMSGLESQPGTDQGQNRQDGGHKTTKPHNPRATTPEAQFVQWNEEITGISDHIQKKRGMTTKDPSQKQDSEPKLQSQLGQASSWSLWSPRSPSFNSSWDSYSRTLHSPATSRRLLFHQ